MQLQNLYSYIMKGGVVLWGSKLASESLFRRGKTKVYDAGRTGK